MTVKVQLLRVFTDKAGKFGDYASVVIDEERHISDLQRQEITRKLNTAETIFINDLASTNISVMHTQGEIDFAGVGVLGASWLLTNIRKKQISNIQGRSGGIKTWQENGVTWIRTDISIMPKWNYKKVESVEAVERFSLKETATMDHMMIWTWIDDSKGLIRARTFAEDWDIPEAEANGSGAMLLANMLQRAIEIKHGKGSVIFAKPAKDNYADVGGRVIKDSVISLVLD